MVGSPDRHASDARALLLARTARERSRGEKRRWAAELRHELP